MNEILTAQEVASMLRISKRQVYELAKEGENLWFAKTKSRGC